MSAVTLVLIILAIVFIIGGIVLYLRKLRREHQKANIPERVYDFGCAPTSAGKVVRGLEKGGKYPEFSSKDD